MPLSVLRLWQGTSLIQTSHVVPLNIGIENSGDTFLSHLAPPDIVILDPTPCKSSPKSLVRDNLTVDLLASEQSGVHGNSSLKVCSLLPLRQLSKLSWSTSVESVDLTQFGIPPDDWDRDITVWRAPAPTLLTRKKICQSI